MSTKQDLKILPIIICPKCYDVMLITFYFDKIELECMNCGYIKSEEFDDIYSSLTKLKTKSEKCEQENCSSNEIKDYCFECKKWLCEKCLLIHNNSGNKNHHYLYEKIQLIIHCENHKNIISNFYCGKCHKHFCEKCQENHKNHKTINLLEYVKKPKNEYINQIEKTKNEYNEYLNTIKNHFIPLFNNEDIHINSPDDIPLLEQSIENNKILSEKVFEVLNMIVTEYNYPNYPLAVNLLRNSNIIYYDMYFDGYDNEYSRDASNDPFIYLQGRRIYIDNFQLEDLSSFVRLNEIKENCVVQNMCLLKENQLAIALENGTINIYDLIISLNDKVDFKHKMTLNDVNGNTILSPLPNGNLITYSDEQNKLVYWEILENSHKSKIVKNKLFDEGISHIEILSNNLLALSAIYGKDIHLYKIENESQINLFKTVNVEEEIHNLYLAKNNHNVVVTSNCFVFIYNQDYSELLKKFQMENEMVFSKIMDFDNINKVAISDGNKLKIINLDNLQIEQVIEVYNLDDISCIIKLENDNLLCGGSNGSLEEYDKNTFKLIQKSNTDLGTFAKLLLLKNNIFLSISLLESVIIWKDE